MLENWIVYGIENGTRVDFLFDDVGSVEVKVRLDVSVNNDVLLEVICALALELKCNYFDVEARQLIDPRRESILQAMSSSRAAKFVKKPRDFIASV